MTEAFLYMVYIGSIVFAGFVAAFIAIKTPGKKHYGKGAK